jgi:tRNA-2-methylthio-N6-dimethylallyladenosine synthase
MNRGYTMSHYRSVAEAVRCCMPDASLTTDLIVGFPSETEQDFEATLNAVREFRFDDAFTYRYSPRAPAKAGPVTDSEHQAAGERLSTLIDLQREISGEQNSKEIGRGCEVLIERQSKQSETEMLCRTEQNRMVVVPTAGRPGSFIQVRITGTAGRTLLGVEA